MMETSDAIAKQTCEVCARVLAHLNAFMCVRVRVAGSAVKGYAAAGGRVILTGSQQPLGFGPNGWSAYARECAFHFYRQSAAPNEQRRPNCSDMTSDRGLCAQKIACGALETLYCVVV